MIDAVTDAVILVSRNMRLTVTLQLSLHPPLIMDILLYFLKPSLPWGASINLNTTTTNNKWSILFETLKCLKFNNIDYYFIHLCTILIKNPSKHPIFKYISVPQFLLSLRSVKIYDLESVYLLYMWFRPLHNF